MLEWQGMPSAGGASDQALFNRNKHQRVNFLDLNIRAVYTTTMVELEFGVFRKPGSSNEYLPYCSYYSRHVFRGWLKAEMHWLLTHSRRRFAAALLPRLFRVGNNIPGHTTSASIWKSYTLPNPDSYWDIPG